MQLWILLQHCFFEAVDYVQCTIVVVGTHVLVD